MVKALYGDMWVAKLGDCPSFSSTENTFGGLGRITSWESLLSTSRN
jgi:hypothetical protein